jgi:hypothetical protein
VQQLTVKLVQALFRMISVNLFRKFPYVSLARRPEHCYDCEFSHIDLVYKILRELISFQNVPKNLVAPCVDQLFINSVFMLVASYDSREQRHVVNILEMITQNFKWAIAPLFRRISRFCVPIDEEFRCPHALPSIVSILVPLVREYVVDVRSAGRFFRDFVLPLHKCENYPQYHETLGRVVVHVLGTDLSLVTPLIIFVTKHWPVTSRDKSALFLNELGEVCDAYAPQIASACASKLIRKVAGLFMDPAADVSQGAIFAMSSGSMLGLLRKAAPALLHIVHQCALLASTNHWVTDTRRFASDLIGNLLELDPGLKSVPQVAEPGDVRRSTVWQFLRDATT